MTGILDPIIPDIELARLKAVQRYEILDTPPDGAFDRIAGLAARLLRAPIAIISVVDTDRIWFKSHHGLADVGEIGRDPGLCASAILQYEPWIVTDASLDPRTLANPLVAGSFGLRFYAGVPLTTTDGYNLGTLCVIDVEPRHINSAEVAHLEDLAALVMDELELRLTARYTLAREERLRREAEQLADALQASLLPPRPPVLPEMEVATRYQPGQRGLKVGGDFFDTFRLAGNDWGIMLGDVCGRGAESASLAALARWAVRASSFHQFSPSDVLREVNDLFSLDADVDRDDRFCTAVFARMQLDVCGAWLTVANAGHPPPVLVRRSGLVEPRTKPAPPIGLFDSIDPIDERIGLGPGDALIFYTDGITESRAPDGETFGEERLIAELSRLAGRPAAQIADTVVEAAQRFSVGGLADDIAVLVVRVPGSAAQNPLERISAATGTPIDRLDLPCHSTPLGSSWAQAGLLRHQG